MLAVLMPVLLNVGWRIWLEDGGPVVFSQKRMGEDGKEFSCLKFRSMMRDGDAGVVFHRHGTP